jgi:hypothetical protein
MKEIRFTQERIDEILSLRKGLDEPISIKGRGWAILTNILTGEITRIEALNIVTNDGDQYYAQLISAESPSDDFKGANAGLRLGTGTGAPTKADIDVATFVSGSGKARKSGYPKTNDTGDADNTGDGVDIVTWTYEYATGEANNGAIAEGAIVDNITTPTAALTHFLFAAAFPKTSADTLKVIINHQLNGI